MTAQATVVSRALNPHRATRGQELTQAESAKDTSGKLMVTYSFRVHTATTRVPAAVKKASNPEPLLVKKLEAGEPVMPAPSRSPWRRVPSPWR